jgi:hypothetical protein
MSDRILTQENDRREAKWRAALADKSLVLEAGADIDEATDSFEDVLATYLRTNSPNARKAVLSKYGAHVLVGLAAVGTKSYEAGTFWPKVAELVDLNELSPIAQQELSGQFRVGLKYFKLSRFETPLRNVGEILVHAGVPFASHCNLLKLMDFLESREYGVDGEFLVDYCKRVGRDDLNIQFGLGTPTFRFLTSAGRIAEDYVDQLFHLTSTPSGEVPSTSLPAGVVAAVASCNERARPRATGNRAAAQRFDRKIRVRFDPRLGVHLQLPLVEVYSEIDVMWTIESRENESRIPRLAPFPGVIPEPELWSIREPSDLVRLNLLPSGEKYNVEVINPDDPLLVFEESSGNLVNGTVPRGRAWIGFPSGSQAADVSDNFDIEGRLTFIGLPTSIYGWDGWSFVHVDLNECESISLRADAYADMERPRIGTPRRVDATHRPFIYGGSPLPDWISVSGSRFCWTEPPELVLPPMQSTDGTWGLRIMDLLSGETIHESRIPYETRETRRALDLPFSSTFEVEVSGSLGRGLREQFTLLHEASVDLSTPFRRQRADEGGLEEARVVISSTEVGKYVVDFDATEDRKKIDMPVASGILSFGLEVPSQLIFTTIKRGKTVAWITPANIATEWAADCRVAVRTPQGLERPLEIRHRDEILQRIQGRRSGEDLVYNLAEAADTLETTRVAELGVVFEGTFFPIGSIRPRKIARSVTVDDNILMFELEDLEKPLSVALYPRFAPWRGPYLHRLPVGSSEIALTPEEIGEGWLEVSIRVENPWRPAPWSDRLEPDHEDTTLVQIGEPAESNFPAAEQTLRTWLSGAGTLSVTTENAPTCLVVYEELLLKTARFSRGPDSIRRELAESLRNFGDDLPRMVTDSVLDIAAKIALLTQTVSHGFTGSLLAKNNSELATLGILNLASQQQVTLLGVDEINRTLGPSAIEILANGKDPDFANPDFRGDFAMRMDGLAEEIVDAMWTALNPVPSRLLDPEQRVLNGRQLFIERRNSRLGELIDRRGEVIGAAAELCESEGYARLRELLMARCHGNGWRDLPAVTIGFAILARGSARGNAMGDTILEDLREAFTTLAWKAPQMMQQDLVLAELWMARHEGVIVDDV